MTIARHVYDDYDGGVIWVQLNNLNSELQEHFIQATKDYGGLRDGKFLVVLEGLANPKEFFPFFDWYSQNSAWLTIVSDKGKLPAIFDNECITVPPMKRTEAIELLSTSDKIANPCLYRRQLLNLANHLGRWPNILKPAAKRLDERLDTGYKIENAIQDVAEDSLLESSFTGLVQGLGSSDRDRFIELSVFHQGATIPLEIVKRFWATTGALSPKNAEGLCMRFRERYLLTGLSLGTPFEYLRLEAGARVVAGSLVSDKTSLHRQLLASHPKSPNWFNLEFDDDYFWRYLTFHLAESDELGAMVDALLNWRFISVAFFKFGRDYLEAEIKKTRAVGTRTNELGRIARALPSNRAWKPQSIEESEAALFPRIQHLAPSISGIPPSSDIQRFKPYIRSIADLPGQMPIPTNLPAKTGDSVICVAFDEKGSNFAVGIPDAGLSIVDRETFDWTSLVPPSYADLSFAVFDSNSKRLASGIEGRILLLNPEDPTACRTFEAGSKVNSIAFSPSGHHVVSAEDDGNLTLWETASGRKLTTLARKGEDDAIGSEGHTTSVTDCVFMADGAHLLSVSSDKSVKLWDIELGRVIRTFQPVLSAPINSCALSPSGKLVATASDDPENSILVWEIRTGKRVARLESRDRVSGHKIPIRARFNECVFNDDGRFIVAASADGFVRVWNADTFEFIAGFQDYGEMFTCDMHGDIIVAGGTLGLYLLHLVQ